MENDERQSPQPQPQPQPQQQHIRPRIQRKSPQTKQKNSQTLPKKDATAANDKSSSSSNNNNRGNRSDAAQETSVEETRKRMESWMGLGTTGSSPSGDKKSNGGGDAPETKDDSSKSKNKNRSHSHNHGNPPTIVVSDHPDRSHRQQQTQKQTQKPKQTQKQPVSILRTPKYSRKSAKSGAVPVGVISSAATTSVAVGGEGPAATVISTAPSRALSAATSVASNGESESDPRSTATASASTAGAGVICKDVVMERDPTIAATKRKSFRRKTRTTTHDAGHASAATATASSSGSATASASASATAIEGYTPSTAPIGTQSPLAAAAAINSIPPNSGREGTDNNKKNNSNNNSNHRGDDDEPLVIDSLEGLMRAAGETLPEHPDVVTPDAKVVEANISFSVMTQDQYEQGLPDLKQQHAEEQRRQLDVFLGKRNIFGDDDDDDDDDDNGDGSASGDGNDDEDEDDDDDDDAMMELLLGSDMEDSDDDDNEESREPEIRAFSLLWNALTNWMTHDTVEWVKALRRKTQAPTERATATDGGNHNTNPSAGSSSSSSSSTDMDTEWTPMVDRSDVGASRCAGVMAMIRLYLGKCLEELSHPPESRKRAEKRLHDFMRTFDYSRENPKLSAKHWRAMACVLLDLVLAEEGTAPRASGEGFDGGGIGAGGDTASGNGNGKGSDRRATTATATAPDVPPSIAAVGMTRTEFEYLSRKAVSTFE